LLRTPVARNASTLLGLNHPDMAVGFNKKTHFYFCQNFLSNFAFHLPLTGATYLWLRRADTLALRTSASYKHEFF
jgi:transposase